MNDSDVLDNMFYGTIIFMLLFNTFIFGFDIGNIVNENNSTNEENNYCICCQKNL